MTPQMKAVKTRNKIQKEYRALVNQAALETKALERAIIDLPASGEASDIEALTGLIEQIKHLQVKLHLEIE